MSDFYKSDVECLIFKVGCRMAPISFGSRENLHVDNRTERVQADLIVDLSCKIRINHD